MRICDVLMLFCAFTLLVFVSTSLILENCFHDCFPFTREDSGGSTMPRYFCASCSCNSPSLGNFSFHCRRVHQNEKGFRIHCSLQQYPYSTKSIKLYKLHVRRNHPAPAPALVEEPQSSDEELKIVTKLLKTSKISSLQNLPFHWKVSTNFHNKPQILW